jgi:hypothetical protein
MKITEKHLKKIICRWIKKIKVKPKQIRIQQMKKKWASCSTKGRVSFNIDLLKETRRFQDYAIVHELLHLIIPNHGKLFKSMMNVYLPGWEKISKDEGDNSWLLKRTFLG